MAWKLVKTDSQHEGWINSWCDRAGLPPCVEDFLHHLLVWLLWLNDDANRNHTKIAAQACFVQYGCQHKTELLYMYRKHATKVMIPFLEPLLQDRELSCRFPTLLSLIAANLEILFTDSEAPSSGLNTRGRPMTIIAIHGGTIMLQATTSLKPRELNRNL